MFAGDDYGDEDMMMGMGGRRGMRGFGMGMWDMSPSAPPLPQVKEDPSIIVD